ncbi:g4868 [Coccomyxa viridis]|uniref:G4868 protein n=1 Tax=Coccomyxa viridis TaxID=1274662 RepID=A0ABP1FTL9_9CHLO
MVPGAMLWASSAQAQDVKGAIDSAAAAATNSSGPPTILGLNLFEVILLAAPPLLYGIFNLYRSQVNQQAKLVDFVSILAATIIFGNILSVLVFKVRLY